MPARNLYVKDSDQKVFEEAESYLKARGLSVSSFVVGAFKGFLTKDRPIPDRQLDLWERAAMGNLAALLGGGDAMMTEEAAGLAAQCADALLVEWRKRFLVAKEEQHGGIEAE